MRIPLNDLFNYCVNNNLCTRMNDVQYEEILNGAGKNKYDICELALLIKFCSDTPKSQCDIIHDLVNIKYGDD